MAVRWQKTSAILALMQKLEAPESTMLEYYGTEGLRVQEALWGDDETPDPDRR